MKRLLLEKLETFQKKREMPVSSPVSIVSFTDFAIKLLIKVSLD